MRLERLTAGPEPGPRVAVVDDTDFDAVAAALGAARSRGWTIAAVIVERDDAVLIGNRFDRSIPIVDEVADTSALPEGALAAVEVAEPGASVEHLSDPLRLAVLLELSPADARGARYAARAVAGQRAAIVVRTERPARPESAPEAPIVLVRRDGETAPLDERAAPPAPGEIAALRGAAGDHDDLLDAHLVPTPGAARGCGLLTATRAAPSARACAALAR